MDLTPPTNARLCRPDGTVIPLELVYVGQDLEDNQVYEATAHVGFHPGDVLKVDTLPAHTSICIPAPDHG